MNESSNQYWWVNSGAFFVKEGGVGKTFFGELGKDSKWQREYLRYNATDTNNSHLERFNRTIQQECLRRIPRNLRSWQKVVPEILRYYNEERPHMGLGMRTPNEIIKTIPSY